jgi:uncharacterized membrane protein YccC
MRRMLGTGSVGTIGFSGAVGVATANGDALPVLVVLAALVGSIIAVAAVIAIRSAKRSDATPEHRAELVKAFLRLLTNERPTR